MNHFVLDGYRSYRSRLDDIFFIYEILEEIPHKMGIKSVMPPFILPYYNGVTPEDCGISGFVFLDGGHFTIHTFSYRETYFADLVYSEGFDGEKLQEIIKHALPTEKSSSFLVERGRSKTFPTKRKIDVENNFGPHLFLDIIDYQGSKTLDELFEIFDSMPSQIGMTPIIRPYGIKNKNVTSIITMIAESHISLHYFEETNKAYIDIFSCKFFDSDMVVAKLKDIFKGKVENEILLPRGSKYGEYKNTLENQHIKSNSWVDNLR